MCVSMYVCVWLNQADAGLLCGSGVTPYQPLCACVPIYISFSTGAKLTLCCVTHFPHCNSLLISNNSRSFGEGGGGWGGNTIQLTIKNRKQARKLALRRKDNPEVKVEVRCRFWWLKVLITVINQLIYTA